MDFKLTRKEKSQALDIPSAISVLAATFLLFIGIVVCTEILVLMLLSQYSASYILRVALIILCVLLIMCLLYNYHVNTSVIYAVYRQKDGANAALYTKYKDYFDRKFTKVHLVSLEEVFK